jgi:hypothetical protein
MTQPSDFKAAVASLLNSFADAANALADELVTSVTDSNQYGVSTSSGGVSPGTVSAPAAPSIPVAEPTATNVVAAVLPDGTPAPVPAPSVDPASVSAPTADTTVSPGATDSTDSISTSTVGSPVTTSDATPPL